MNTPPSPFNPTALPGTHPPDELWQAIADSTLPPETALPHLLHAAQCRPCAELLAAATASYAAPPPETEEEAAFLAQLASSAPATQRALAQKLQPEPEQLQPTFTLPPPRRRFAFWTTLTAAALTLCAATVFLVRALRPPSDTQLVALAYNRYRTSELRLPDSAAVPLASPTRGPDTHQFESIELLKARTRAQEEFERNPNDPRVRQFRGEVYIVAHDPEAARRDFEMAEALNPNLPRLKFDLATAYFELAESAPLNYAYAIDYFSQYLNEVHNADPVALFDLALCYERNSINYQAIKNFEAALALERDPAWRAEIQRHLAKLKAQAALDLSPEQLEATLTPQHFLTLTTESPGQYELYLDAATRKWLPARQPTTTALPTTNVRHPERSEGPLYFVTTPNNPRPATAAPAPDPNLEPALQKLAQWGLSHHDRWLTDILRQPQTPGNLRATQTLAQAVTASAAGKADDALAASALAITQFSATHNHPGQLRAQAEHIYALQRALRNGECNTESVQELGDPQIQSDAWLNSFILLEHASCYGRGGHFEALRHLSEQSLSVSQSANLPSSSLSAMGGIIAAELRQGDLADAWGAAGSALPHCEGLSHEAARRYQLIFDLGQVAERLGLLWAKQGISADASALTRRIGNPQLVAQAAEKLALDETAVGLIQDALGEFNTAESQLASLGNTKATELYRAEWKVDQAKLIDRRDGPTAALAFLRDTDKNFEHVDGFESRMAFSDEFSRLQRKSGHFQESLSTAWEAIRLAEERLAAIETEQQRQAWAIQTRSVYETAVLDLVEIGQERQALALWNLSRSAPYRRGQATRTALPNSPFELSDPDYVRQISTHQTVVYAKVDELYVAWFIQIPSEKNWIMRRVLTKPQTLVQLTRTLRDLCSEPNTNLADISLTGTMAYSALLAPFSPYLNNTDTLQLDLDESLSHVPFSALKHDGKFVGLDRPLIYLQRTYTTSHPKRTEAAPPNSLQNTLILRESNSSDKPAIPDAYNESMGIRGFLRSARVETVGVRRTDQNVNLSGSRYLSNELRAATLIHYTGHGVEASSNSTEKETSITPRASLQPGTLLYCQLAVLAACQTAHEREDSTEYVIPLVRVILNAGAENALASQWDIDSHATNIIMENFYKGLVARMPFDQALLEAQQSLVRKDFDHPFFWAPFQIIKAIPISQ